MHEKLYILDIVKNYYITTQDIQDWFTRKNLSLTCHICATKCWEVEIVKFSSDQETEAALLTCCNCSYLMPLNLSKILFDPIYGIYQIKGWETKNLPVKNQILFKDQKIASNTLDELTEHSINKVRLVSLKES